MTIDNPAGGPASVTETADAPRKKYRSLSPVLVGAILLYIALIIFFGATTGSFFSVDNLRVLATQVSVLAIVSMGQLLVVLSGGFDLSVAGVIPLAGVVYVELTNGGIPIPLAVALVLVLGALYGCVNGFFITRLKVSPLVATLGTMSIAQGLAFTVTNGLTVPMKDPTAAFISQIKIGNVSLFVFILVVIAVVLAVILRRTIYGRSIYAAGGSGEAARLAGMRVSLIATSTYAISSLLAALAGVILSSQLLAGSPSVGSDAALTSIAAVVLGGAALAGGVGGVGGTVVGILIIGTLANGMALLEVPTFYQLIATGAVLLVAVSIGRIRRRRKIAPPSPQPLHQE